MQERLKVYHESLNQYIDAASEYVSGEDDADFITDDAALPVGYQESEGEYFGLQDMPDIDKMIDTENARVAADLYDKFVGVNVILPNSGEQKLIAKVKRKIKSDDRNRPSFYNPLRDHSIYEIEFPDGSTDEVEADLISECMVTDCDSEGHEYKLLREISDHRKDNTALDVADGSYRTRAENPIPRRTTRGWKLLLEWVDRSMDWVLPRSSSGICCSKRHCI